MSSNVRLLNDVRIDAPLEVVWDALTRPEQIYEWFGWQYEGLKEEIQQIFTDGCTADTAAHTLRWETGDEMQLMGEGDSATRMRTFRPVADVDPMAEQAEDIDEGWIAFVEQLRFWIERHRGEQRVTVYLSGAGLQKHDSVAAALGLAVDAAVGDRYESESIVGERLSGIVWSSQGNVSCLTVDALNDGLVVLVDHDTQRHAPNGGGTVTLTTFGLSPERQEEARRAWVGAWLKRYEASGDFGGETRV